MKVLSATTGRMEQRQHCGTLAVFADLMNHNERGSVEFFRDEAKDSLVFSFIRSVSAGEEVCLNYGKHSSSQLLLNYGFIDDKKLELRLDIYASLKFEEGGVPALLKRTLLNLLNALLPEENVPGQGSFLLELTTGGVDNPRYSVCSIPSNLMALLRLSHVILLPSDVNHDSDIVKALLQKNTADGSSNAFVCPADCIILNIPGKIISLKNEVEALQGLHQYLQARKERYMKRSVATVPSGKTLNASKIHQQRLQQAEKLVAEEMTALTAFINAIQQKIQALVKSIIS
jgi:hypothetical protein